MRTWLSGCAALAAACLLVCSATARAAENLVFGVYPHLSASQIASHHFLLRDLIARTLGRPVSMVSAPDLQSFAERTRKGEFDIVLTAPHLGRLAEQRDGWQRVAQSGYRTEIVVLARSDGELRQLADLRGRTLAVAASDSLDYQIVAAALVQQDLALEHDVTAVAAPTFSAVMYALTRGTAEAGATSKRLWDMASGSQRAFSKEIYLAPPAPGFFVMAHPRLGKPAIQSLHQALVQFHETREGKAYFRKTELIDFRPIDDATMRGLDAHTAVLTQSR
jgi:phosphonate transport system substrate-binding protein